MERAIRTKTSEGSKAERGSDGHGCLNILAQAWLPIFLTMDY